MVFTVKNMVGLVLLIVCLYFPADGWSDDSSPESGLSATPERELSKRPAYRKDEILVRYKPDAAKQRMRVSNRRAGGQALTPLEKKGIHRIRVGPGMDIEEVIEEYRNSGMVLEAERHVLRYVQEIDPPDDTLFRDQWSLEAGDALNAWTISHSSPEVVVAVIDTGIDYYHEDLKDNIWINEGEIPDNGIDDDGNGYVDDVYGYDFGDENNDPMDKHGHGTHVAGIIGATGNNGIGVAGVSWNVKLMPLKASSGDGGVFNSQDIMEAIQYARAQGVKIFNFSFGGDAASAIEEEILRAARQDGLFICAAGNDEADIDIDGNQVYPASYDLENIISVAAMCKDGNLCDFSNYGSSSVDLMAPGRKIKSTSSNDLYGLMSGTSTAAPYISGLVALMSARQPESGYAQLKSAILDNVDPVDSAGWQMVSGGRVNLYNALGDLLVAGDITGDDKLRLDDVILTIQLMSGIRPTEPILFHPDHSDVNGDGRIGMEEAIYLMEKIPR